MARRISFRVGKTMLWQSKALRFLEGCIGTSLMILLLIIDAALQFYPTTAGSSISYMVTLICTGIFAGELCLRFVCSAYISRNIREEENRVLQGQKYSNISPEKKE